MVRQAAARRPGLVVVFGQLVSVLGAEADTSMQASVCIEGATCPASLLQKSKELVSSSVGAEAEDDHSRGGSGSVQFGSSVQVGRIFRAFEYFSDTTDELARGRALVAAAASAGLNWTLEHAIDHGQLSSYKLNRSTPSSTANAEKQTVMGRVSSWCQTFEDDFEGDCNEQAGNILSTAIDFAATGEFDAESIASDLIDFGVEMVAMKMPFVGTIAAIAVSFLKPLIFGSEEEEEDPLLGQMKDLAEQAFKKSKEYFDRSSMRDIVQSAKVEFAAVLEDLQFSPTILSNLQEQSPDSTSWKNSLLTYTLLMHHNVNLLALKLKGKKPDAFGDEEKYAYSILPVGAQVMEVQMSLLLQIGGLVGPDSKKMVASRMYDAMVADPGSNWEQWVLKYSAVVSDYAVTEFSRIDWSPLSYSGCHLQDQHPGPQVPLVQKCTFHCLGPQSTRGKLFGAFDAEDAARCTVGGTWSESNEGKSTCDCSCPPASPGPSPSNSATSRPTPSSSVASTATPSPIRGVGRMGLYQESGSTHQPVSPDINTRDCKDERFRCCRSKCLNPGIDDLCNEAGKQALQTQVTKRLEAPKRMMMSLASAARKVYFGGILWYSHSFLRDGYCGDYVYLPERVRDGQNYPARLAEGHLLYDRDAASECMMRCLSAAKVAAEIGTQAFYLQNAGSKCACSRGACESGSSGSSTYKSYQIVQHVYSYKVLRDGYCGDYEYLPEEVRDGQNYPARLTEGHPLYDQDAPFECMKRCLSAARFAAEIGTQAFYLQKASGKCACSKGACASGSRSSSTYKSYQIVQHEV